MVRCDACSFEYDALPLDHVPATTRRLAADLAARLHKYDAPVLKCRPAPEVWSALEYACHVRDVLTVQHERLLLALAEDTPEPPSMDASGRVIRLRYNEQEPSTVADGVTHAAGVFADACAAMTPAGFSRTLVYTWPVRTERTLAWLVRHTVHEQLHHLRDVDDCVRTALVAKS